MGDRWSPYSKGIFESVGGGDQVPLDNAPMLPGWDYLQVRYEDPSSRFGASMQQYARDPQWDCVKFGLWKGVRVWECWISPRMRIQILWIEIEEN